MIARFLGPCLMLVILQGLVAAASSTTPELVCSVPQSLDLTINVFKVGARATSKPATLPAVATTRRLLVPSGVEEYEVRLVTTSSKQGALLWQFQRSTFDEFSSERMRYKVLSVALIRDHLFIAQKMTLGTSVVMVRIAHGDEPASMVMTKHLMGDDDVHGPSVVSARFRIGRTLADSWLSVNPDDKPEFRREFRLSDHFKEATTKSTSSAE